MGSERKFPNINGRLDDRDTPYYHMVINAGFLPNKKRNRISVSTGLLVKNNQRKAANVLSQTITLLTEARAKTGILELKKLFELITDFAIDDMPSNPGDDTLNPDNPLFSVVVKKWLEFVDVSDNTREKYRYATKHVIAYFEEKGIKVKDLDSEDIADYFTHKKKGSPDSGIKPLSAL